MFLVLPFRDHNPSKRFPFVNYSLIAINVLIFLAYDDQLYYDIFITYALYPYDIIYLSRLETLITSGFLHADFQHLFFNMLVLYLFGDNLEDVLGHLRYLLFYLFCMISADLIHIGSSVIFGGLDIPLIGASGAISGVVGGYLLLFPKAKIDFFFWLIIFIRVFSLSAWFVLGAWVSLEIWDVYSGSFLSHNVATFAHLGGFFCGLILIFPRWIRLGGTKFWQETGGKPKNPETFTDKRAVKIPLIRRR